MQPSILLGHGSPLAILPEFCAHQHPQGPFNRPTSQPGWSKLVMGSWIMFSQVPDFAFVFAEFQKATVSPLLHPISFSRRRCWETHQKPQRHWERQCPLLSPPNFALHIPLIHSISCGSWQDLLNCSGESWDGDSSIVPSLLEVGAEAGGCQRVPSTEWVQLWGPPISANPLGTAGDLPDFWSCQTMEQAAKCMVAAQALSSFWSLWQHMSVFRWAGKEAKG